MKLGGLLLVALEVAFCSGSSTTTATKSLRGGKVIQTRTVHHSTPHDQLDKSNLRAEPLVAAKSHPETHQHEHHHYVKVQGKNKYGEPRTMVLDLDQLEDKLPHDSPIFTKNNHVFHDEVHSPRQTASGMRGGISETRKVTSESTPDEASSHPHVRGKQPEQQLRAQNPVVDTLDLTRLRRNYHSHRGDQDLHHGGHEMHFDGHDGVERHHEHHHNQLQGDKQRNATSYKMTFDWESEENYFNLPTGFPFHFNQTLFDKLHDAPFVVYEEALGHELEDGESFPVFALPQRVETLGVFTGFSKYASPLIFENVQFLLKWDQLQEASDAVIPNVLERHIADNNFRANLIVGKSIGNGGNVPFTGIVLSYYQYGREKNVLVPFSKLEDFFDDMSEKHLLDPATKSLEMAALHEMLEEKRSGYSKFYHPALAHTERRKQALEDLDTAQFHKLFQLLIRRAYLFAYGYADCLLSEPERLRHCLDATFYDLIKMETEVRGALDEEILETLVDINQTFHNKVSEACIATQGSGTGMIYGSGSCHTHSDLGAFVTIGGHGSGMARFMAS